MHRTCVAAVAALVMVADASGQSTTQAPAPAAPSKPSPAARPPANQRPATPPVPAPPPPPGYVIGADDVLSIVYWRDKDMSTDVQVRPDGKISLSLINEIDAAGLTPDQLREKLLAASKEFIEDPNVSVIVKAINSRRVYITGQVAKQGPYPLTGPMTAMQLISLAGGVAEFADSKNIRILRIENGKQISHKLNYKEVSDGKKLAQNIELRPGDTVIVP